MKWTQKIKPDNLTKVLFVLFIFLFGLGIFLSLQLAQGRENIEVSPVNAQSQFSFQCIGGNRRVEYNPGCNGPVGTPNYSFEVWCNNSQCNESPGNCTQRNGRCETGNAGSPTPTPQPGLPNCSDGEFQAGQCQCGGNVCYLGNPTCQPGSPFVCTSRDNIDYEGADDRDPKAVPGASCRHASGGGRCAVSTFYSGCNPGPGQICVCSGASPAGDGWSYGTTVLRPLENYIECGIMDCSLPQNRGRGGEARLCRNPHVCPGEPLPSPSPSPTPTSTSTPTPTQTPPSTPTPTPSRPPATPTPTPPAQQNPNISIEKQLVSPNFQPVGSNIVFNIVVRNTGDVDIRNFTLSDSYDPDYLEFIGATYRNQIINPTSTSNQDGRRLLTWTNMPPKSNIIADEDGVLTRGEVFTLTVTFRILTATSQELLDENENCGLITTIEYRDNENQERIITYNPPRRSCDGFDTPTENPLTVTVNKQVLTPSVVLPNQVRFVGTIRNNDAVRRTYTVINFTDEYDARYLRPNSVIARNPAGRTSTVTNIPNTGVLRIANLQNLRDSAGTELGPLLFNQEYSLEIVFDTIAPINRTCDTIFADVETGDQGGTSNRSTACAEIVAPTPPETGANLLVNLLLPLTTLVSAGYAHIAIRKKLA
jgi:uncharacterized repeat protein (TIGR01451 family)